MRKFSSFFLAALVLLVCCSCSQQQIEEVEIFGHTVQADAEEITFSGDEIPGISELSSNLKLLKNLKKADLGSFHMFEEEMRALSDEFPDVTFEYIPYVSVAGRVVPNDVDSLDLSGRPVTDDLTELLKSFPLLKTINLHDTGMHREQLLELKAAYPELIVQAEVELAGELFSTEAEELDLNSREIPDPDEFMESLVLFDRLSKVEMCDCGLSNEQMAAIRDAYPDTKFVWRIHLGKWSLRTDAVAFSVLITRFDYRRMTSEDIEVLKYCTDLQALDVGHQAITDISVIGEYLTDLRVLIVADNRITDLSPLANLPHLHYLEFFMNRVKDLTPLSQCRELVDLNISYNPGLSDITPLLDLPMLERLWMVSVPVSRADTNLLRETYPDVKLVNTGYGSTGSGWRTHDRYFAMIDMYRKKDYISEEFSKYDGMG